ncbi:hypothetical protein BV898_11635 [Hypsibius exemplaris]|uniref:Uncharacterized protein n=1 Tax=Hypsibius exemplaris TaxID=2072580 RepID=A0A1W0WG26_HYPEX|nr:hypothetical protein BV898_11635 [Hypsibius exemplaris]
MVVIFSTIPLLFFFIISCSLNIIVSADHNKRDKKHEPWTLTLKDRVLEKSPNRRTDSADGGSDRSSVAMKDNGARLLPGPGSQLNANMTSLLSSPALNSSLSNWLLQIRNFSGAPGWGDLSANFTSGLNRTGRGDFGGGGYGGGGYGGGCCGNDGLLLTLLLRGRHHHEPAQEKKQDSNLPALALFTLLGLALIGRMPTQ